MIVTTTPRKLADTIRENPNADIVAVQGGQAVAVSTAAARRLAERMAARGRAGGAKVTDAKRAALARARSAKAAKAATAATKEAAQ